VLEITSVPSSAARAIGVVVNVSAAPIINARFSSFIGDLAPAPMYRKRVASSAEIALIPRVSVD